MWPKKYKDYPPQNSLIHQKVESSKGIIGCEMHEINSWGEELHHPPPPKDPGHLQTLFTWLFRRTPQ